jgi:hypothetical protein
MNTEAPGTPSSPHPDRQLRISGPADLIAAVPYLLGFAPAESAVLIGLSGQQIAVTARVDLADGPAATHETLRLLQTRTDATLVIAYTEQPAPAWLSELPGAVLDTLLVSDGRWRSLLCPDRFCCPPEGQPLPSGTSVLAASAVSLGLAPLPSRDELAAALRPGTVTAQADAAAAALAPIPARDRAWLAIDSHTGDTEQLHRLAADYLDTARHCTQDARAAAVWFLYAWTQWRLGNGARANLALGHATDADPHYSAAALLQAALQHGLDPHTTPTLASLNDTDYAAADDTAVRPPGSGSSTTADRR